MRNILLLPLPRSVDLVIIEGDFVPLIGFEPKYSRFYSRVRANLAKITSIQFYEKWLDVIGLGKDLFNS